MNTITVKICGITNREDGVAAAGLGADYLGFIFAPSPRRVSAALARRIISQLEGKVSIVGVFLNQEINEVTNTAAEVGLDYIQLHGTESPAYCSRLQRPVIKRIDVSGLNGSAEIEEKMSQYKVAHILLDPDRKSVV